MARNTHTDTVRIAGRLLIWMALALLFLPSVSAAGANVIARQVEIQRFRPGEVVEHVASLSDPNQSYAVYLPAAYGPDRSWPVLFALDPRGRALIPLELFREAAERHGYIIISSYNTASDTAEDPNTPAMRAMLADTPQLFVADEHRIYITGFSGTARVGWYFASQLGEYAAGLIGFGGGLPPGFALPESLSFAFFGAAGTTDFNYEEMLSLDADLASRGAIHRFMGFEGAHDWGSPETCATALDWMELQAMKAGRREVDVSLVGELYREGLGAARELEVAGDTLQAFRLYRTIAEDFSGLRETEEATAQATALEDMDAVRDGIALEMELARRSDAYFEVLSGFLRSVQAVDELPRLGEVLRDLRISALKREAAGSSNRLEADAAQRLLEKVFVNAAFYGPRDLLRNGEAWRALLLLEVADAIKKDDFNVLVNFARAYASVGEEEKAIEALLQADAIVTLQASWLEEDPYLQALADEPEFQALLKRRRPGSRC